MSDPKDMPKDEPVPDKTGTDELSIDQLEQCVGGLSYHGTIPDFLRTVVDDKT